MTHRRRQSEPLETTRAFFESEEFLRTLLAEKEPAHTDIEVRGALKLSGWTAGDRIVDLGCGFGRHAAAMSQLGLHVTGVDLSGRLLSAARRRSEHADRPPTWVRADYAQLPFDDHSADGLLCVGTSFGYDTDERNLLTLREWARVLKPGGKLVLHTMHRDRTLAGFQARENRTLPNGYMLMIDRVFHPWTGVLEETQRLKDDEGVHPARAWRIRLYCATELRAMLAQAGFSVADPYGGPAGGRFDAADPLWLVAQRD